MKLVQFFMIVRGWYRSGLSSVISLVSLGVGLICATILLLFVVDEYRVATSLGTSDNIYFVEQQDMFTKGETKYTKNIDLNEIVTIAENYPEVVQYAMFEALRWKWQDEQQVDWEGDPVISASSNFAQMVNIKMEVGSLDSVLAHPDQIALTRSYANRIFPDGDPIGQTIRGQSAGNMWVNGVRISDDKTLTVTAIIDDSEKSFLKMRGIFLLPEEKIRSTVSFGSNFGLIQLREGVNDTLFCRKIAVDTSVQKYNLKSFHLTKLQKVYFSPAENLPVLRSQNENTLWIGTTIAFAILLIAAFNYINITMIRAPRRLKNLSGQRIMGASKWNVRWQIIVDTAFNVAVAFAVALICMPPSMELFNSFMGSNLQLEQVFELRNLPYIILLLVILIGLPALNLVAKMAIRNPLEVFKNPKGRKLQAMQTLVIVQFVISVTLIAFSLNVGRQMDFVAQTIPNSDKILQLKYGDSPKINDFLDYVKNEATTISTLEGKLTAHMRSYNKGFMYHEAATFPNYFDFLGIKIIEGRTFDSVATDEKTQSVVNQTFVKINDLKGSPLGYEFEFNGKAYRVVGVCEDASYENVKEIAQPTIYVLSRQPQTGIINIRFRGTTQEKIDQVKSTYTAMTQDTLTAPQVATVQDFLVNQNPEIKRLQTMVWIFALISILLTAIGMFGLSWYTVEHRRKEIAIRKIHGASTNRMVGMLTTGFLRWVAVATVIALPTAYFISGYWLDGFAYKVDNSIAVLVVTALFITIITFVTVIYQTVRVARTNPANTIKTE